MAASKAVLRRVQCRATSKATGRRCRRWCSPGALTCRVHGAASPQAARSAERRELVAELVQAGPGSVPADGRRTIAAIVADAVHLGDLQLQDATAARTAEQAEVAVKLVHATVRLASDLGVAIGPDVGERAAEETGARVAEALRTVGAAMLHSLRSPSSDYRELESWLLKAVPAAIRGQVLPACPKPWVMSSWPALESASSVRARWEAEAAAAMRGAVGAPSGVSDTGEAGPGAPGHAGEAVGATPGSVPASPAAELSARLEHEMWRGGSSFAVRPQRAARNLAES